MTIWILAVLVFAFLAWMGYLKGAIRVTVMLVGLIVAAILALPLAHWVKPLFPMMGVVNPYLLWILPPITVFILVQFIFAGIAFLVHRQVALYYKYKDSIDKLKKENELAQIEAFDEQQRAERIRLEQQEAKEKRIRVQYMGIVIGIGVLFVALVMMGWFKVSANTIRAIGFFSFLLFFEFIFLVFKKNIYGLTHGEPLYDLAFMIALAAILVPLHHWLEHKVIHFLTSHHMLKLRRVFSRKEEGNS